MMRPTKKRIFAFLSILSAWITIYILLTDFYKCIVEAIVASARGGRYHMYMLRGAPFLWFILFAILNSAFLALSLWRIDYDKEKES